MANSKDTDRRVATQERSDLDMAITELHQTIVRLNKVINQVQTTPTAPKAQEAATTTLSLETLLIPKIYH